MSPIQETCFRNHFR